MTNYIWDSLDRSQELTYPAQFGVSGNPRKKVEPLYDIASRVDTLKYDATSYASSFVYNASSQVESLAIGSQITETYTFDGSTGLLFEQEVKKGATTHLKLKYNYTTNNSSTNTGAKTGQLTGITDLTTGQQSRSKAYVYDKLGRLKEAKGGSDAFFNPSWTQTYAYDRYGNRTGVSKSGSGSGSIPLDGLASLAYTNAQSQTVNNRITTAGYEYDPAGNQTRGQTDGGTWRRYKYDAAGRLAVALDDSSNPLETYNYGASNERLMTVYGNGLGAPATYYCWEGGQVIADFRAGTSSNLVWEKNYVYLGGRLLATTDLNGTKYHHPDRLGTRLVTDTSGNVSSEQANLPYGTALAAESSGGFNNRRFTSYDRSATTGMDYAVNRFYNSAQGRFNQVDPIGMGAVSLSNPQSLNLYGYCENDPINHVDPDGLFLGKLFGWIGGVIKKVAKVFAVWLAVAAVLAFSLGSAGIGIAALIGAGIFAAIGWGSGKLSEFAGAFLGTLGKTGNFRTPGINGNASAGGIQAYLNQNASTNVPKQYYPPYYEDAKAAAIEALRKINKTSRKKNKEHAGSICRDSSGRVFTTGPNEGTSNSSNVGSCPSGDLRIGTYHTHAAYDKAIDNTRYGGKDWNEEFSTSADIPNAGRRGVPNFLATPKRNIKVYIPNNSVYAGPDISGGRFETFKERTP